MVTKSDSDDNNGRLIDDGEDISCKKYLFMWMEIKVWIMINEWYDLDNNDIDNVNWHGNSYYDENYNAIVIMFKTIMIIIMLKIYNDSVVTARIIAVPIRTVPNNKITIITVITTKMSIMRDKNFRNEIIYSDIFELMILTCLFTKLAVKVCIVDNYKKMKNDASFFISTCSPRPCSWMSLRS